MIVRLPQVCTSSTMTRPSERDVLDMAQKILVADKLAEEGLEFLKQRRRIV